MSIDPKDFDMPVASFNPNPMKLGLFTDGLPNMKFEEVLDAAVEMGIEVLELGTGGYSCAPPLDMKKLLESAQARKEYLNAIESRGLKIAALNCSANAIGPGERWKSHAPDVMNTFRLAELLGVKHIVSQSGLPAGSPTDTTLNWVLHTYPPEMEDVLKYQWEVTIEFWSKAAELAKSCGYAPLMLLGAAGDCSPRMFAQRKDFEELAEFSAGIASAIEGIACDQVLDVRFVSVQEVSWRIAYSMDEYRPYWEARLAEADALLAAGDKSAKINGVSPFFFKKLVNKKLAIDAVDITLPSQVIALGDLVIVTSEGELASAFGKQIKASRPDKCVVICGYTNGFQHYMMPAEEYGVGMESLDSVFPEGEVEHYIEAIEEALARL